MRVQCAAYSLNLYCRVWARVWESTVCRHLCGRRRRVFRAPAVLLPGRSSAFAAHAGVYAIAEVAFFARQQLCYQAANGVRPVAPDSDVEKRVAQFKTLAGIVDLRDFLSGWFMQAPVRVCARTPHTCGRPLDNRADVCSLRSCDPCARCGVLHI